MGKDNEIDSDPPGSPDVTDPRAVQELLAVIIEIPQICILYSVKTLSMASA